MKNTLHSRMIKLIAIGLIITSGVAAQTLYVPSGTSGVGTSTTANIGIGVAAPATKLEMKGDELRIRSIVSKTDVTGRGLLRLTSDDSSIGVNNLEMLFSLFGGTIGGQRYGQIQVGDNGYSWASLALNPYGGKVGIGTSNPLGLLHVSGNTNAVAILDGYGGSTGTIMQGRYARGTPTSPSATETDYGLLVLQGAGYNGSAFTSRRADIGIRAAENWTSTANGTYMAFRNTPVGTLDPVEVMRITSTGSVGLGTASPLGLLHVSGNSNAVAILDGYGGGTGTILQGRYARGTPASPSATAIDFGLLVLQGAGYNGSAFTSRRADISIRAAEDWTPTANGTYMAFRNTPIGSQNPIEVMRMTSTGGLGIGLTDPRWRLGVSDGIEVRADDADSKLTFHDPGSVWYTMGIDYSDNRNFKLGFGGNVGDATDVTLTPGGNLGLGTNAPQTQLDVVSSDFYMARFQGLTTTNQAVLIGNASGANYMNIGIGANTSTAGVPYIWGNNGKFMIGNDGGPVFFVSGQGTTDGKIGIRTINPTHPLTVNGTIRAREIIVDNTAWSDYVFAPDYALAPLSEVEAHIKAEKHLPGIPSAREVAEHGISVGEMQAKLLAKIEELTLHQIEQEKQLAAQRAQAAQLSAQNAQLFARVERLEAENSQLKTR